MTAANMYRYRRNCPISGVNVTIIGSRVGLWIMPDLALVLYKFLLCRVFSINEGILESIHITNCFVVVIIIIIIIIMLLTTAFLTKFY